MGGPDDDTDPGFEDEPVTGIVCLDCGGSFRWLVDKVGGATVERCAHCTRGAMSPSQEVAWKARLGTTSRP